MRLAVLAALLMAGSFALAGTRVIRFQNVSTPQALQEAATVIRGVGGIDAVSVDAGSGSVVLAGTTEQIALAEWLNTELDRTPSTERASREYRFADEDVVRIFYMPELAAVQQFQEP